MNPFGSDGELLARLGQNLAAERLRRNITQDALAQEAGLSRSTLRRLEAGESTQLVALIRVLRALDLLAGLDLLLPSPSVSPLEVLENQGEQRQRASSPKEPESPKPWTWGEDR